MLWLCSGLADCTEENQGDHPAGETTGAEAPAGHLHDTPLQVTVRAAPAGTCR